MSSTLPPEFDLTRLRGIPDPVPAERAPALEPPALPGQSATRALRIARQRLALTLAAGWMVGQLAVLGARHDLSEVPLTYLAALVVAPVIATAFALALALAPGRLGLGVRPALLMAAVIGLPLSLLVAGLLLSPAYEDGRAATFAEGLRCCAIMIAWAAAPLVLAALVLRRWFVLRAGPRSALVGVAAGMAAAATMNLHCAVTGVWHVALGHSAAVVVATAAGAWALAVRTRA